MVNGVTIVDAQEGNDLMGMAIVYYPACPEARAQTLVAEADGARLMASVFASANIQLAEMDIDIVRGKFWKALCKRYDDEVWQMRVLLMCPDCVIYYDDNGRTWKVEYRIENDDMCITDWYEVDFVRAQRGENEMEKEKILSQNEQQEVAAEVLNAAEAAETLSAEDDRKNKCAVEEDTQRQDAPEEEAPEEEKDVQAE